MRELPTINLNRCAVCGDCVMVCPVNCLEMTAIGPWLPRPTDCIDCSACVLICPADALEMQSPKQA